MAPAGDGAPSRSNFITPVEREWVPLEDGEGVFFVESGADDGRWGPLPREEARREATRLNEYEFVVALAEAVRTAEGKSTLDRFASEARFESASDPLLAAALVVLYERDEYDEALEVDDEPPTVRIDRFLLRAGPSRVLVREFDTPEDAGFNLESLHEEA